MGFDLPKLLKLLLPTLCIFYAFSAPEAPRNSLYREVFGNPDYYLDVYFETNPKGMFQQGAAQNLRFSGYLVHGEQQVPIDGRRVDWNGERLYLFDSKFGKFKGRLAKAEGRCEPALHFQVDGAKPAPESGILRAGFCQ